LYSEGEQSPLNIEENPPVYSDDPKSVDGRVVLRDNFDKLFAKYPETLVFGEDTGKLGDVNKGLENMQDKYGEIRVSDTGIREATILGQGIGMALRGLRPIAEIQYLDYLLYCFQGLSDDLATVRYRSMGGQKAPLIVRTRGHRLEGIWHTGSPMGMIINGIRGVHVCVPRTLTEAAGMYNTLLQGDDPALIIEPLNAYRLKEDLPENLGEFTVPLGIPKVVSEGTDITIVSYGSTCNICEDVLPELEEAGISAELIDVRTLLPFDSNQDIVESLKKTNRILFVDEDVPGGASAFMMNKVIQDQKGYYYLDSEPQCLTAKEHRAAYGSDGDYFSKPNEEDIFEAVYALMSEANPAKYPPIYE
jgi:pyruvate/2-oxoglutarate/acetoin dehydrogenase E1 component